MRQGHVKSIRWRGFRCFDDTGQIDLKPITILIGPNDCGKTSIMAPLLALRQTLDSLDMSVQFKTSGPLVDLGLYRDYIKDHDVEARFSLSFDLVTGRPKDDPPHPVGKYPPGSLRLEFEAADDGRGAHLVTSEVDDALGRRMLRREWLPGSHRYSLRFYPKTDLDMTPTDRRIMAAARRSAPEHFLFTATELVNALAAYQQEAKEASGEFSLRGRAFTYFGILGFVEHHLRTQLKDIAYIGPLRSPPQRYYQTIGEMPRDVGPAGEYMPEILFQEPDGDALAAVEKFLVDRQLCRKLVCAPAARTEGFFQINLITTAGLTVPLCDAGFGLSQLMPLLVQASYAREGSLIIAEQPEIHLNPVLQCELADLLVLLADGSRNILLETHSEHLLLRLRRLVAHGEVDPAKIAIYFVVRDATGSQVTPIPLEANGNVEPGKWPEGFLDDYVRETFALADAQAQRGAN